MNDSYFYEKADARGCHWDDVLAALLYQSYLLQHGIRSHSLVGGRHLLHAKCSLNAVIVETCLDAASSDAHFELFSAISGSWGHGEALGAIRMLDANVDFGVPVEQPAEYAVEHPGRPSEHLQSFASYYFANFVIEFGLDPGLILTDSDMNSDYLDIAVQSPPDLTSNRIIVVDTG